MFTYMTLDPSPLHFSLDNLETVYFETPYFQKKTQPTILLCPFWNAQGAYEA